MFSLIPHPRGGGYRQVREQGMTKLKIDGMTCGHCVMAVTKALAKVPGVDKVVDVSLEQKQAVVSGSAADAALIAAVADAGYEAQVV